MDVVYLLEKHLGGKANIEFLPMQPDDVKKSYADIDKSIKLLDYKPSINIDVGVEIFVGWYKKYRAELND